MKENMAAEQIFRNTKPEEIPDASTSTKNFQDEVRQWFTAMSPEGRAAVLGFEDDSLIIAALMARVESPSLPSSTTPHGNENNSGISSDKEEPSKQVTISIRQSSPTSSLPPKRTTNEHFTNGT